MGSLCQESSVLPDRDSNNRHGGHHNISERIKILWLPPTLFHGVCEDGINCMWSLATYSKSDTTYQSLGLSFSLQSYSPVLDEFPLWGNKSKGHVFLGLSQFAITIFLPELSKFQA